MTKTSSGEMEFLRRVFPAVALSLLCVFALYVASGYRLGSPARMGPGFFLVSVATVLLGLSLLHLITGVEGERAARFDLKAIGIVTAAISFFAWSVNWAGLVAASAISAFIAMLPYDELRWPLKLACSFIAGIVIGGIFVLLLQINVPLLPRF